MDSFDSCTAATGKYKNQKSAGEPALLVSTGCLLEREPQALQDLVSIIPGQGCSGAAAAQHNYDHGADDQRRIISPRGFQHWVR
jgi:hypothetical protein